MWPLCHSKGSVGVTSVSICILSYKVLHYLLIIFYFLLLLMMDLIRFQLMIFTDGDDLHHTAAIM